MADGLGDGLALLLSDGGALLFSNGGAFLLRDGGALLFRDKLALLLKCGADNRDLLLAALILRGVVTLVIKDDIALAPGDEINLGVLDRVAHLLRLVPALLLQLRLAERSRDAGKGGRDSQQQQAQNLSIESLVTNDTIWINRNSRILMSLRPRTKKKYTTITTERLQAQIFEKQ